MELHICMRILAESVTVRWRLLKSALFTSIHWNSNTKLGIYWRKLIARQKQVFTRFFTSVEIKPLKQNSHCDTAKGFKTVLSMPYLVSKKRAIAQFTRSCSNRHSFHKTTCCKNRKEGRVATDHDNWSYGAWKNFTAETLGLSFIAFNDSQLSNLWRIPNSVRKGFGPAMKMGSSRRFKRYPTTYMWVSSRLPFTVD